MLGCLLEVAVHFAQRFFRQFAGGNVHFHAVPRHRAVGPLARRGGILEPAYAPAGQPALHLRAYREFFHQGIFFQGLHDGAVFGKYLPVEFFRVSFHVLGGNFIEAFHAMADIGKLPGAVHLAHHLVNHGIGEVVRQVVQLLFAFPQGQLGVSMFFKLLLQLRGPFLDPTLQQAMGVAQFLFILLAVGNVPDDRLQHGPAVHMHAGKAYLGRELHPGVSPPMDPFELIKAFFQRFGNTSVGERMRIDTARLIRGRNVRRMHLAEFRHVAASEHGQGRWIGVKKGSFVQQHHRIPGGLKQHAIPGFIARQGGLRLFARTDILHNRHNGGAPVNFEAGKKDFRREFPAVVTPLVYPLEAVCPVREGGRDVPGGLKHRVHTVGLAGRRQVRGMLGTKLRRVAAAEHLHRSLVAVEKALVIQQHDGIAGGLVKRTVPRFILRQRVLCLPVFRNIGHDHTADSGPVLVPGGNRSQADPEGMCFRAHHAQFDQLRLAGGEYAHRILVEQVPVFGLDKGAGRAANKHVAVCAQQGGRGVVDIANITRFIQGEIAYGRQIIKIQVLFPRGDQSRLDTLQFLK
ncbi:MAG: hypothetical protein BWX80_02960 [Candidatus Hydrogenedentes bacterium ADurb.Bin101]|nr:MAG: hypothetical protein BWX80_02960 [Candidatus Hydrogenedentes bacterium ADurb.Bin101]